MTYSIPMNFRPHLYVRVERLAWRNYRQCIARICEARKSHLLPTKESEALYEIWREARIRRDVIPRPARRRYRKGGLNLCLPPNSVTP